jgi:preprotein translocase subunit SecF
MAIKSEQPKFDFMIHKPWWFTISAVLLVPGLIAIVFSMMQFHSPVKLGIDFTGGTLAQFTFQKTVSVPEVESVLNAAGLKEHHVQISGDKVAIIRTAALTSPQRQTLMEAFKAKEGPFTADSFQSVGPTIGKELLTNALMALLITILGIVGYISYRYQLDFALCGIAALLHDVLFLVGVFAILGLFFGIEVDSLFVTALLTVVGFSVHDTIVIYDRIRENMRTAGKRDTFDDVANRSIWQTLRRSINTSLTVCLTLLAMLVFGGETIRWFVFAMLLGILSGTYSSIFNASQLLSVWRMFGVKKRATV